MKFNSLLLISLLICSTLLGQVTQRNLLANKYNREQVAKVLFTKDQWKPYPKTPAEWRSAVPDSIIERMISTAARHNKFNFKPISATISLDFVRSGDRERHSDISFNKREVLMQLVVAESMEGKGQFMESIMNGIWSICEESYWGVPAHIRGTGLPDVENPVVDLFTAETAATLSLADYFVGEKLDTINKLLRKRIYFETDKRLFTPMQKNSKNYKWMSRSEPVNNWNPWIMSNWILSTLLVEKNEERRNMMIYEALYGLDAYLNSLGDDGGCDEGPSYWFAAGASVFDCLDLLHKATNGSIDIYDNDLIRKMAGYITQTHIAKNYFVNFADADPTLTPDGLMLYRLGMAVKDSSLVVLGKWAQQNFPMKNVGGFMKMRQVANLLEVKNVDRTSVNYNPPVQAWIKDVQILTARSTKGLFLGTHGGHNSESHNHNDVGDLIVYFKGEPMIVDAGRGNYTARTFSNQRYQLWFTRSEYHNLPIINGVGQKEGRQYQANGVVATLNDSRASLKMDIAAAYPAQAGVSSWKRDVSLDRKKELIEIADEYILSQKPKSLQQVFMTVCDVDLNHKGKIYLRSNTGNQLSINYDPKLWKVSTDMPSVEGMEYESFKTKWGGKKITRIVLDGTVLQSNGKHRFSISPE